MLQMRDKWQGLKITEKIKKGLGREITSLCFAKGGPINSFSYDIIHVMFRVWGFNPKTRGSVQIDHIKHRMETTQGKKGNTAHRELISLTNLPQHNTLHRLTMDNDDDIMVNDEVVMGN